MKNKLLSLQLIRAFAAIIVANCHIWNDGWLPGAVVDYGGFGVDLFFVLSGFIMCLTVRLNQDSKFKNGIGFLRKRIVRIFPIYLICALPLIIYVVHIEGNKGLPFYVSNFLLLPSFEGAGFSLALPPGWTLVYEMLFYYTFTLLLLLTTDKKTLISALFGVIAGTWIFVNAFGLQGSRGAWINFTFIIGHTQLLNFAGGILVYLIYERFKDKISVSLTHGLVVLILFSGLLVFLIWQKIPKDWFALLFAILIILVFTFIKINQPEKPFLKNLLFLGDASYSIYLTHFYWAFFKPKVVAFLGLLITDRDMLINVSGILCMLGAILTGSVFYVLIEKPIIKFFAYKKTSLDEKDASVQGVLARQFETESLRKERG